MRLSVTDVRAFAIAGALVLAVHPVIAEPSAAPLRTLEAVRDLTPEQAAQGLPVHVTPIVTYYHHAWSMMFVQDATGGVYVYIDPRQPPMPVRVGQRVELQGKTVPGDFVPSIAQPRARPLADVGLPAPRASTLKDIAAGQQDASWIEVRGVVQRAAIVDDLLDLTVSLEGGRLRARIMDWQDDPAYARLVDSVVRIQGVCSTVTDQQRQFLGAELWVPHRRQVQVTEPAPEDPFAVPPRSLDSLRRFTFAGGHERRLKVAGNVTLDAPGRGIFIQDAGDGILVETSGRPDLRVGDRIEAVGFLGAGGYRPRLEEAIIRRLGSGPSPAPLVVTARELLARGVDARLVKIRGNYVGPITVAGDSALVFQDGDVAFDARLAAGSVREVLESLRPASHVELVGVASVTAYDARATRAFEVLLASPSDIDVIYRPSSWTAARAGWLAGAAGLSVTTLAGALAVIRRRRQGRRKSMAPQPEPVRQRDYRELVEGACDLIFRLDADGRFTFVNAAAERILGYRPEQLEGSTWARLAGPGQGGLARRLVAEARLAPLRRFELDVVTADGRAVHLEISTSPCAGQHQCHGIARDVSPARAISPLP